MAVNFGRSFSLELPGYGLIEYTQRHLVGIGCKRRHRKDTDTITDLAKGLRTILKSGSIGFRYQWDLSLRLTKNEWTALQAFLFEHAKRIRDNSGKSAFVMLRDRVMPLNGPGDFRDRIRDGDEDFDEILGGIGIRFYGLFETFLIPQYPPRLIGSQAGDPAWEIDLVAVETNETTPINTTNPDKVQYFVASRGGVGICPGAGDPIALTWDGEYPGQPFSDQTAWLSAFNTFFTAAGISLDNRESAQSAAFSLMPNLKLANIESTPETYGDNTGEIDITGNRRTVEITFTNRSVSNVVGFMHFSLSIYYLKPGRVLILYTLDFGTPTDVVFGAEFPLFLALNLGAFTVYACRLSINYIIPDFPFSCALIPNLVTTFRFLDAFWFPDTNTGYPGILHFSAPSYSVGRPGSTGSVTLATIKRSGGSLGRVTVLVAIDTLASPPGTAIPGTDYTGIPSRVVFENGETLKTFSATIMPGSSVTLKLLLTSFSGGAVAGLYWTATTITLGSPISYLDSFTISFLDNEDFEYL